jgi:hypothetical protein
MGTIILMILAFGAIILQAVKIDRQNDRISELEESEAIHQEEIAGVLGVLEAHEKMLATVQKPKPNSSDNFMNIASEMLTVVKQSLGEGDEVNKAYVEKIQELEAELSGIKDSYDGLVEVLKAKDREIERLKTKVN